MALLTRTDSMEAHFGSVSAFTDPGSSQTMTEQTLSLDGPAGSENHNSAGSSMTSHSEFGHNNDATMYAGHLQTIHNYPTTEHHFLQHLPQYHNPMNYPPGIGEEDEALANAPPPPQTNQQTLQTPPRTPQPGPNLSQQNRIFNSPRQNNTAEQNIRHYRPNLRMSPPPTPHINDTAHPPPSIHMHTTEQVTPTPIQNWEATYTPDDRMRVGLLRWEGGASELQQYLDEYVSNVALDEPFQT